MLDSENRKAISDLFFQLWFLKTTEWYSALLNSGLMGCLILVCLLGLKMVGFSGTSWSNGPPSGIGTHDGIFKFSYHQSSTFKNIVDGCGNFFPPPCNCPSCVRVWILVWARSRVSPDRSCLVPPEIKLHSWTLSIFIIAVSFFNSSLDNC